MLIQEDETSNPIYQNLVSKIIRVQNPISIVCLGLDIEINYNYFHNIVKIEAIYKHRNMNLAMLYSLETNNLNTEEITAILKHIKIYPNIEYKFSDGTNVIMVKLYSANEFNKTYIKLIKFTTDVVKSLLNHKFAIYDPQSLKIMI